MNTIPLEVMVRCVGWALVHFIWQGLAIIALLAICLRLLRSGSANKRYFSGCVALLMMAVGPIITFNYLAAQHQPGPTVHFTSTTAVDTVTIPASPRISPSAVVHIAQTPAPVPSLNQRLEQILSWFVALWAIGVLGLSMKVFLGWLGVSRLRHSGTQRLEEPWISQLAGLKQRLQISRPVRLLKSALVEVPTVIGWMHPVILLPASCLTGLTPMQIEAIL
ncbi:MAG: peptidase BlaR1, partial [Pedosphaera sp.]|nr:peptidase BlaR1 [Pedosphaera sp.]